MFGLFRKKYDVFRISPEEFRPEVIFDLNKNKFLFEGKCCPENGFTLFNPIFDWFEMNSEILPKKFTIEIKLDYFNSVSHKLILRWLRKLLELDSEVTIEWYCHIGDDLIAHHADIYLELLPNLKLKKVWHEDI